MNRKSHILIFLSICFFVLSYIVHNKKGTTQSQDYLKGLYFSDIQNNLAKVCKDVENEVHRAEEHMTAGDVNHFTSNRSVFFIENGQVVHWTDYRMPFDTRFASRDLNWQHVNTPQGQFLVYSHNFIRYNSVRQIVGVVEIHRDYHLSSDYLKSGFNNEIFGSISILNVTDRVKGNENLLKINNKIIGQVKFDVLNQESDKARVLWLFLLVFSYVLLIFYVILWLNSYLKNKLFLRGFLLILFFMLLSRGLMLYFSFPQKYFDVKLFNPQIYASSTINASFGDLLLNITCLMILVIYAFVWLAKYKMYHQLIKLSGYYKHLVSAFFVCLSFGVSIFLFYLFNSIYLNSQVNFDITESLHFDEAEMIYIVIFCFLILMFFLLNHFVMNVLNVLLFKNKKLIIYHVLPQFLLFAVIEYYLLDIYWWLACINLFYLITCTSFELFQNVKNFQYKTYLYFTLTALSCAVITSFCIADVSEAKDLEFKKRFSEHLILHNDIQGEVIMSEIANHIQKEEQISRNLMNPYVRKEVIEELVRDRYLSNYFDKYEIHFSYYNKEGKAYFSNIYEGGLDTIKSIIVSEENKTWVDGLYFITDFKKDFSSKYYHFMDLTYHGEFAGTVMIEYTLKKYIAKSILPGLLRFSTVEGYMHSDNYDYAIYLNNELQYSVGDFNYNEPNFKSIIANKQDQGFDLDYAHFKHFIDYGADNKTIVVSSKPDRYYKLITNFSFHFLLLVLILLIYLSISSVLYFVKSRSTDFSSKIQTYLNISTFAPMILLSILILSLMASSYRKDQEWQFRNNADILSSHVLGYLEDYKENKIGIYELKNSIDKLSKYSGTDINIYDAHGKLVISNQPLLYESGVMSNLINPEASKEIFEMKHRMVELEEKIGEFTYNTVYVALTTPETSEFMGVMSIPFFNSTKQMEQKKISALSIIINVFAIAFILLLVASYFVTKSLTSPLRLIANKLRKVETGHKNEPLYWDSNDELGLLISEYNQMLQKIEESKLTFAQTEKELAWKEMAQQVAHEIKNPLTPMKLKLQHLQRVIGNGDERTNTTIDSLLEQVDTLSDIASSFSSFAKMPVPEIHKVNISEICLQVISLYDQNEDYSILHNIPSDLFVKGDAKLLGRIITNLLLNGIQSVPDNRKALIKIELLVKGEICVFSIRDNGAGIPLDIQDKVFVPNFTTKYSGSGIGLAIAKNGIEQMGGKIWFETSRDKGTTFYIELSLI